MKKADLVTAFQTSSRVPTSTLTTAFGEASSVAETIGAMMDLAIAEYSRDSGYKDTVTGTSAGTDITLPKWYRDSRVLEIEAPVGTRPKTYLRSDEYEVDSDAGTVSLLTLGLGTAYKIRYRALHSIEVAGDNETVTDGTLTTADVEPFFALIAAKMLMRVSAYYAATTGSAFSADSVNYGGKGDEYRRLATAVYAEYRRLLGLPEKYEPDGASVAVAAAPSFSRIMPEEPTWLD